MTRTRKRQYRGSRRFDRSCRNHGSCAWCEGNRLYNARRRTMVAIDDIKWLDEPPTGEEMDTLKSIRYDDPTEIEW